MSTPPVVIGGLTLDESYAPLTNMSFEYFTTQGGEIIGGQQKFTVSGVVSVSDDPNNPGLSTGASVMTKLQSIRAIGRQPQCFNVTIPGLYSGKAKVMNVNIEQGNDPSWVNQGAFNIELAAPLSNIPANSFNFTVNDFVKDVSKSETIQIGEEAHGYVYDLNGNKLSKTFVKFTHEINLTCQPLCSDQTIPSTIAILKRIVSCGPTNSVFTDKYGSWKQFLQNRSLEINTNGSVTFRCEMILVPPSVSADAFVDISFEHNRVYDPQQQQMTKKTTGSITGLVSVGWSDLVSLSDTCSVSKLSNAESAFTTIKPILSNLNYWDGSELELSSLPNCPSNINQNCVSSGNNQSTACYKPTNSTISKSRTEGIINFDFEWSNSQCQTYDGQTVVDVEIVEPTDQIVEHIIPDFGTLIQNLNCKTPKTIQFVGTTTYPGANGCATNILCSANDAINAKILEYIPAGDPNWLLIENKKTTTLNSVSITKKYIRKCI